MTIFIIPGGIECSYNDNLQYPWTTFIPRPGGGGGGVVGWWWWWWGGWVLGGWGGGGVGGGGWGLGFEDGGLGVGVGVGVGWVGWCVCRAGWGVTKAPFINFFVIDIFDVAQLHIKCFECQSYLTAVAAATPVIWYSISKNGFVFLKSWGRGNLP